MNTLICQQCGGTRRRNHVGKPGFCKPCHAAYQRTYRATHKETIRAKDQRLVEQRRNLTRQARNKPCADCMVTHPYWVMDFDHPPGVQKITEVSTMVSQGFSAKRILAEIKKCDVVCANCHRTRTHLRRKRKSAS